MCERCTAARNGYRTLLEIRKTLEIPNNTPLWIRDLGYPDNPRYLVNVYGAIISMQEPDCEVWFLRLPCDGADVKDGCPPDNGEFDKKLVDEGDTMLFDIRPDIWTYFYGKS